jgi:hypothetical protein
MVQHEVVLSSPPRSGGFLSSLSSDPETGAPYPRTTQVAQGSSSSHVQQPHRGVEFSQAPKPVWQRDEVVAPVIIAGPLAGFLSTLLF